MKRVILLLVSILLISLAHSFAAVPCKINYQGRLIKDNVPVDGQVNMEFKLWTDERLVDQIYLKKTISLGNVPVYNGLFRVVLDLGDVDWTAGQVFYLEVKAGNDTLTPREPIYAYPYAINSHLLEGATKEYFLNTSGDSQTKQGNLNIGGNLSVGGAQFEHKGYNFLLGTDDGREKGNKQLQRALVHDGNDKLFINYNTDFEGGVKIEPSVYISTNGNVGIGTTSPSEKLDVGGKVKATGLVGCGLIERGNVNEYDFYQDMPATSYFTCDENWRDLDLSSIVPEGAKMVLLFVAGRSGAANDYFKLRKKGYSDYMNVSGIWCPGNGVYDAVDAIVPCDSNRVIQYQARGTWPILCITVKGWWK